MLKKFLLFLLFPATDSAQFQTGSSILGPHIGISNVARATVLGAKFEQAIADLGAGTVGVSAKLDYYSWNSGPLGVQSYYFAVIAAQYHLRLEENLDPFAGIGAGYLYERNTWSDPSTGLNYYTPDGSGFKFLLTLGARYYLSPSIAVRLEFGSSLVYAVGGFDFGF